MNWIEVIAFVFVSLGLVAGAFLVAQRPAFWIEFGARIIAVLMPFILKRMTPEEEAEWRAAERAGRGEEWLRKRRGAPPKG